MTDTAKSLSLLLVEDDLDTASLIRETVEDYFGQGCVHSCSTIAQVLALDPAQFDLVLSDMNLPDGNALELIAELLARRADLPVILVTGEGIVENAMKAIRQGAYDYIVKAGDYLFAIPLMVEKNLAIWQTKEENRRLNEELTRTLNEVNVKNRQLEAAVTQLAAMAATDPLTGLANRRTLAQTMDRSFAEATRYGHDLACIMIDLDGFKLLNDNLGHQHGDEMLKSIAQILLNSSRRSDTVGRFGGDEFIILLPQTDLETAVHVADRIAAEFRAATHTLISDPSIAQRFSMSMGVASLHLSHPKQPRQLLSHADLALYRAKQLGRNRMVVYTPEMAQLAVAG